MLESGLPAYFMALMHETDLAISLHVFKKYLLIKYILPMNIAIYIYMCVCVCVCVF